MVAKLFIGGLAACALMTAAGPDEEWSTALTSPTFLAALGILIATVVAAFQSRSAKKEAALAVKAVNGHLAALAAKDEADKKDREHEGRARTAEIADAAFKAGELFATKAAELLAAKLAVAAAPVAAAAPAATAKAVDDDGKVVDIDPTKGVAP